MNEMEKTYLINLRKMIEHKAPIDEISGYSYVFYLDYFIDDPRLEYIVKYLMGMNASPEFELNYDEIISFIQQELNINIMTLS